MEIFHTLKLKTIIDEKTISAEMLQTLVNMDEDFRTQFFTNMATELFIETDLLGKLNEGNSWALLEVVK